MKKGMQRTYDKLLNLETSQREQTVRKSDNDSPSWHDHCTLESTVHLSTKQRANRKKSLRLQASSWQSLFVEAIHDYSSEHNKRAVHFMCESRWAAWAMLYRPCIAQNSVQPGGEYKVSSPLMGRQNSAAGRSRLAYRSQWVTLPLSQCSLHCCHISQAIICCIVWVFLFISLLQITLLECCCLLWGCNLCKTLYGAALKTCTSKWKVWVRPSARLQGFQGRHALLVQSLELSVGQRFDSWGRW